MRLIIVTSVSLLPLIACAPEAPVAPIGTFTLDANSTKAFTETHYRTKERVDELAARAMGTQLAAALQGNVELQRDGSGTLHIEDRGGAIVHVAGPWNQTDRQIALTGREPGSGTFEFDWIDGSGALHLQVPIGEAEGILVFQATSSTGD